MQKFGNAVVRLRKWILVVAVVLMVPSILGLCATRINYDMLTYLPEDMDTVTGQNLLMEEFGKGAFSFIVVEGMEDRQVSELRAKLEQVEHVDTVLWYDSILDPSVPKELLPQRLYDAFNAEDATMLAVFFDTSTSADATMEAVQTIRSLAGKQCFVSGMSAMVTDLKDLCEREEPIYVGLAVLLSCVAMMLLLDNWLVPLVFLVSIGMAILLNMGSNYFLGEISYLTKALSAVLQLAVTMDYSIFLWHSYTEQRAACGEPKRAMARAVADTITSVVGSSITTVAGFLALCFMSFTLGKDLGLVMAKGVILGVLGCVTTLPALLLALDPLLSKTQHRPLLPRADRLASFVTKHAWVFLVIFALLVAPAWLGYAKTNEEVYYDLGEALPRDMDYVIANSELKEKFGVSTTHMVLVDASMPAKQVRSMMDEMEQVPGVQYVLGLESVVGSLVPEEALPASVTGLLKSQRWELLLINSQYDVASDQVNEQIDQLNGIIKSYDQGGMLIGEAPCTKDMIEVTDRDFQVVTWISIAAVFILIALVLKSLTLPVILVAVIEFAIFINLGLPHYLDTSLPFVAPICISTIQLGSTVDYAILMTTRYRRERASGLAKRPAVTKALAASMSSVLVSAFGFFAATFGVGLYSDIDIISSMCDLMARGAAVSMLCVIFVLPALFMLLDPVICATSLGFRSKKIQITEGTL